MSDLDTATSPKQELDDLMQRVRQIVGRHSDGPADQPPAGSYTRSGSPVSENVSLQTALAGQAEFNHLMVELVSSLFDHVVKLEEGLNRFDRRLATQTASAPFGKQPLSNWDDVTGETSE